MPKINDWERVYWRNASGDREYDPNGIEPDESVLSIYENARGERVAYRYAEQQETTEGEEAPKYEVLFNGDLIEDVVLDGENFDEEEFDALQFGTRREAREASSDFMRALAPIDESKLVDPDDVEDEDEAYSYDDLQDLARPRGIKANQSADDLRSALKSAV